MPKYRVPLCRSHRGYTLKELLIVFVLLSLWMTIAIPLHMPLMPDEGNTREQQLFTLEMRTVARIFSALKVSP